jgi:hypothetical protein
MVRLHCIEVADQRLQNLGAMSAATASVPVEEADRPLVQQFVEARPRQRSEMRIGEVGEDEGHDSSGNLPENPWLS